MQLREHRLENGLQVVAECNPRAYSTALAFFVNAGSRDETPELAGVSHFLEHMMFKGTPRRTAADVNRELDELGSHSNAFTSEEHTVYYAAVLPEYQDAIVDLLADIMRPSLRQEDFDTEKLVILEEILKYEDQPPFGAHEKCMEAYFRDHPLGNNVLGSVESITALSSEAMRAYFQTRYSPGNMTLVAAGNVDFDALVRSAQQACGDWPPVATYREMPAASPHSGMEFVLKESAAQQYIVQICGGPCSEDSDLTRQAGRVLATIFGDDSGSRLYWDLVDTGHCEYAAMAAYEFQGAGVYMTYLCCVPEKLEENLERLQTAQEKLQKQGITEAELELAVNKICSQMVRQSERPSNRMFSVGSHWLQRQQYRTVQERLATYQTIDRDTIHRLLAEFPLTPNTTVAAGPARPTQ